MRSLALLLFVAIFISSCSDEKTEPKVDLAEFINLKPGNYWIYDWYEVTSSGNEKFSGQRDSVYIAKDTLINGNVAYIKRWNFRGSGKFLKLILFDSANAVYTFPERDIIFSLDPDIFYSTNIPGELPTVGTATFALQDGLHDVDVPAGKFSCVNFQGVYKFYEGISPTRYNDNFYTEGVGLIKMSTFSIGNPNAFEMRLVKTGRQF